jgi:sporulation protein YlmC with PRC-barrel domain
MIDLPIKAEVLCSDGMAGFSTYIIGNPINNQVTHLVVKSIRPPFPEYLVPVAAVIETTPNQVNLNCTRDEMEKMEPFEYEEYVRTVYPNYLALPYIQSAQVTREDVVEYVSVKHHNVPQGEREFAVWRGAKVQATDGYVGQVDELLINANNMKVTHLVLLERHIFEHREISIPVSQIDRILGETIYLKLDRKSIEELPTTPIQRWQLDEHKKAHFTSGA